MSKPKVVYTEKECKGTPLIFGNKASVTMRFIKGYPVYKRNVYYLRGIGTFIKHKGKCYTVSYTKFNNTAHTLLNPYY